MASVIGSARKSTASVFDLIGHTADVGVQLVANASLATDALTSKTRRMHARVLDNEHIGKLDDRCQLIEQASADYADRQEQIHRRASPNEPFDWKEVYDAHVAMLVDSFK